MTRQVWVRTGLTGTHEEPAIVVDDAQPEEADGEIVVKYNVSGIVESVEPSRVRDFLQSDDGGGRGRRTRAQPDRFGSVVAAVAAAATPASASSVTSASSSRGRSRVAPVTPSPAESPVPVKMLSDEEERESSDDDTSLVSKASSKKKKAKKGQSTKAKNAKAKTKTGTKAVPATPPPSKKRKAKSNDDEEGGVLTSLDEPVESPYFSPPEKKKAKTANKSAKGTAKATKGATSKKASAKTKKPAAKKTTTRKKSRKTSAAASSSASISSAAALSSGSRTTAASNSNGSAAAASESASSSRPRAGQPDGNGGLNQPIPFFAEYSKSGRATCRRCDEKILKGQLRIGHRPLFRGKPGFTVYRHLQCAVFAEHIQCAEDVDGAEDLNPDDYELLAERIEKSVEEMKKEQEELEPDELVQVKFEGEIRPSPPGLTATLLPFQVEGASWMYHQEVNEPAIRGGVLADEMGMGKTLQSIVTILDNRPKLQHATPGAKHPPSSPDLSALKAETALWDDSLKDWKTEMEMNNVPKCILPSARKSKRAGTLVICPVIALTQWKTEIEKFTDAGSLSVCIYHGPDRATDIPREMLRKYDIVLTTYQVLEADMRKMISPNKVKCPNCGGKFKIDKLRVHLKYFCGEGAERTEAQARTIRNRDRDGDGRGGRRGGSGGGGGGSFSKKGKTKGIGSKKGTGKKAFVDEKKKGSRASSKGKKETSSSNKTKVRVKGGEEYDSESDLSVADAAITPSPRGRSSRSAAKQATKQMSSSATSWMETGDDNEDEYLRASSSEESDSSDDEDFGAKKRPIKSTKNAKRSATKISFDEESEDDASSSSDDDFVVKRVREKQRKALEAAKAGKKKSASKGGKKKDAKNTKKTKKAGGKKTMKKKARGKGDPGSSDDSSSDEDDDRDPLDGIDMDALMEEAMAGSQMSVLHSLCWWRIVLDEAHFIKSRSSQTANAAFALIGINRWALSGTPLQNRVGEFYSLIRFLRLDPMAHYICRQKGCDCKSLHYRMMHGKCQGCGHGSVQHYSHFNKYVLNPIQRDGYSGDGRRAMFILKDQVLDKCLFRRTKETKAEDMNLPPRLVTIRPVRLHPIEEDYYKSLYTQTKTSFDDYENSGTLSNNYAHVFDLLMRLRQSVDHPYLVIHSKKDKDFAAAIGQSRGPAIANGTADCDICHEPPTDRVVSSCCQAAYCRGCVLEYMSTLGEGSTPCPSCRAPFTIDLNQVQHDVVDDTTLAVDRPDQKSTSSIGMPALKELTHVSSGSILRRINLAEFATSSKIEALTEELVRMRQTSPGSKAIVFSQFVNMLDLIRWRLHSDPCLADMGLGARALHGGMDVKARDAVLKDFREDNNVRVLLMSLKAGGVALNLTVANHLYLMDPWWNPAAEMQAIDRTHRLGQYRPIRAVRFIAENTVEERILQLQEKKRLVFDGTVGRDAGSLKMLSVDDMKALFN